MLASGTEVIVVRLGRALVVRHDAKQATVELLERNRLKVTVPVEQVTLPGGRRLVEIVLDGSATAGAETSARDDTTATSATDWAARRAIEALRFGLVPVELLGELTVGFAQLAEWVEGQLPSQHRDRQTFSQVTGPFGTGKSHMMAVIRSVARQNNYLTAHVEVDGVSVSLSDPAQLLCSLWTKLTGNALGADYPTLNLYERAWTTRKGTPRVGAKGVDRVRESFDTVGLLVQAALIDKYADELDQVLSCDDQITAIGAMRLIRRELALQASDVRLHRMIGRRVEERPADMVEVLIGSAQLAKLAGFAGLVITIDEFEVEDNLSLARLQRVAELLKLLNKFFGGQTSYPEVPLALVIATVGEEGHGMKRLVEAMVNNAKGKTFALRPWNETEYAELARKIHAVYVRAYLTNATFDAVEAVAVLKAMERVDADDASLVRSFIKAYVAMLDLKHGPTVS